MCTRCHNPAVFRRTTGSSTTSPLTRASAKDRFPAHAASDRLTHIDIAGKQGIGALAWQCLAERGIACDPLPHQLAVFSCHGPLPAHTPDKSRISASVTISVIGSAGDGSKPSA
jgi:hypothetical protein